MSKIKKISTGKNVSLPNYIDSYNNRDSFETRHVTISRDDFNNINHKLKKYDNLKKERKRESVNSFIDRNEILSYVLLVVGLGVSFWIGRKLVNSVTDKKEVRTGFILLGMFGGYIFLNEKYPALSKPALVASSAMLVDDFLEGL